MSTVKYYTSVYIAFLRAALGVSIMYRAQLVIWVLTGLFPLLMMVVWIIIAQDNPDGSVGGFSRVTFVSYYLAVTVIRRLCGVWIIWDLDEDIRMGMLSAKLLRPIDPVHNYFAMSLTDKPVEMAFVLPPIILAMWWFRAEYDLTAVNFLLVGIGIFGAICIEFFVSMTIGALGFWITQMLSVIQVWFYLRAFFSGWIIPLALFPEALQSFLLYAPFRYALSFPVEILMGQLTPSEIAVGFSIQWGWVLIFFTTYRLLWRKGISQFSAVGA